MSQSYSASSPNFSQKKLFREGAAGRYGCARRPTDPNVSQGRHVSGSAGAWSKPGMHVPGSAAAWSTAGDDAQALMKKHS